MVRFSLIGGSICAVWVAALFSVVGATSAFAQAAERIIDFHEEIWVNGDGSVRVESQIEFESAGIDIKRGLFRDFPTDYRSQFGNYRVRSDIAFSDVRRDGKPESYHTEAIANGVRSFLGHQDVFLDDGRHRYVMTYTADRRIGHGDRDAG